ncbi:MAG: hypothetical protein ACRDQA_05895 [Nocardioidaceae bacterium]
MSGTVNLHIGVAKTGTTYLQRLLYRNRQLLQDNGVLFPGNRRSSHFLASMDLRETGFKGHRYPGADGAWGAVVAEAEEFAGDTVISHETLARSSSETIERAVGSFQRSKVRVVVTCRDLGRQIPAVWQEGVKNRKSVGYDDFMSDIFVKWDAGSPGRGRFWTPQDLTALTHRWSAVVGAENLVIVTVPPSGGDRRELWRRFAHATDLPDLGYDFDLHSHNASLGVPQSELLRRLNEVLPEDLEWPQYEARIKRRFAEYVLAPLEGDRLVVPESRRRDVVRISGQMIESLGAGGYTVVGDLEDLRPVFPDEPSRKPGEVPTHELLTLALRVLGQYAAQPLPRRGGSSPVVSTRELAKAVARSARQRLGARLHRAHLSDSS